MACKIDALKWLVLFDDVGVKATGWLVNILNDRVDVVLADTWFLSFVICYCKRFAQGCVCCSTERWLMNMTPVFYKFIACETITLSSVSKISWSPAQWYGAWFHVSWHENVAELVCTDPAITTFRHSLPRLRCDRPTARRWLWNILQRSPSKV